MYSSMVLVSRPLGGLCIILAHQQHWNCDGNVEILVLVCRCVNCMHCLSRVVGQYSSHMYPVQQKCGIVQLYFGVIICVTLYRFSFTCFS